MALFSSRFIFWLCTMPLVGWYCLSNYAGIVTDCVAITQLYVTENAMDAFNLKNKIKIHIKPRYGHFYDTARRKL